MGFRLLHSAPSCSLTDEAARWTWKKCHSSGSSSWLPPPPNSSGPIPLPIWRKLQKLKAAGREDWRPASGEAEGGSRQLLGEGKPLSVLHSHPPHIYNISVGV